MIRIQIPEATCGTNEIIRKFHHPQQKKRERDRWHWQIAAVIGPDRGPVIDCCEITVTRRARNPMDWDNMGGGLKFVLDALVSNKIILDDRPSVVRRLDLRQRVTRKQDPATIIEIVPLIDG